jgi:hypothetical protein
MEDTMADNGKKPVPKKPVRKAPAKPKAKVDPYRFPLKKLSKVRFVNEDGEVFQLVPHRPWGNYNLRRVPK